MNFLLDAFLCFRLQDDNSVRSFLDCAWVSTDILKRNELDHPEDADLIIGYLFQVFSSPVKQIERFNNYLFVLSLFQGELEQLVIIPNPGAVAQQCSSTKIPIFDPTFSDSVESPNPRRPKERDEDGRNRRKNNVDNNIEPYDYEMEVSDENDETQKKTIKYEPEEEIAAEGSGNGLPFNKTNYGWYSYR